MGGGVSGAAAFGRPVVFLAVLTIAVQPLPGWPVLAAATVAMVA
jgi:hypothetical protein